MKNRDQPFEKPVMVDSASGLPAALESVAQSIVAIEALPRSIRDRVHWRFALSIQKMVSGDSTIDQELARRALVFALTEEGWFLASDGIKSRNL